MADAIESGEPHRSAKEVDERDEVAVAIRDSGEHDIVNQESRRDAETHDIGNGIKLPAEIALAASEACHATIEQIEDAGSENKQDGVIVIHRRASGHHALKNADNRCCAAEEIARRHQIGQEVDFWVLIRHGE